MTRLRRRALGLACAATLGAALAGLAGCGEKIAVPRPVGLFSVSAYYQEDTFADAQPVQLVVAQSQLFVVTAGDGMLTKRNQSYDPGPTAGPFGEPTAVCTDEASEVLFLWDQAERTVHYFTVADLAPLGSTRLGEGDTGVRRCVALAACATGIEVEQGARTFLYLADPDSGVIHRYAFDDLSGLRPYGILARRDTTAASVRFVNDPAGMLPDHEGMLLVCEADSTRNWVTRFDPTPDFADTTPDTNDQDPLRGRVVVFDQATCEPPAAADFTLGDAAECGEETSWVGGPSDREGEFHGPCALARDGAHRIYVADRRNDRIQIFTADGAYEMLFGTDELTPSPSSLGVADFRYDSGEDDVNFGAYVFVLVPEAGEVRKFISADEYIRLNQTPPPDQ